ncbi:hypothetical protein CHS0354_026470 [Potamilus streckersoni]|uniref:Uncharacterized protein n=1 Tax=Potamilus streckersoni TaxID=2493646 RepID=A0AAE0VGY3_9BIVA|nr:hypothetical protein CHS0354_026470 [Potamilus streckersoni]
MMHQKKNKNKDKKSEVSSAWPRQKLNHAAFDPTKNTHLWTMWRIAVNEKLLNEFKSHDSDSKHFPSQSLTRPPLANYIRVTGTTRRLANVKMATRDNILNNDDDKLQTEQFIYYGIPRISIRNQATQSGPDLKHAADSETGL